MGGAWMFLIITVWRTWPRSLVGMDVTTASIWPFAPL